MRVTVNGPSLYNYHDKDGMMHEEAGWSGSWCSVPAAAHSLIMDDSTSQSHFSTLPRALRLLPRLTRSPSPAGMLSQSERPCFYMPLLSHPNHTASSGQVSQATLAVKVRQVILETCY